MRSSLPLTTCLFGLATAQSAILGFNSGAVLANGIPKMQSDYEKEFKTAQSLVGSPGVFNSIRLYTNIQPNTDNTPIAAFQAAINTNTTMLLGVWCSGTDSIDQELAALSSAITQYGQPFADLVVGISVGSEDLYRDSATGIVNKAGIGQGPDIMVSFIKQVRSALSQTALSKTPVGHVDTWDTWGNSSNKAVLDAVDFLGTDLYPYYESGKAVANTIDNATILFDAAINATLAVAGDKPVWITETGWPTSGPNFGDATPSVSNAQTYWDEIGCKLFGKTNVWWYDLFDTNTDDTANFAVTDSLSTTPIFNLTCPTIEDTPQASNNASSTASGSSATTGTASNTASSTGSSTGGSSGSSSGSASGSTASAKSNAGKVGSQEAMVFAAFGALAYFLL
jgi:glucan endo-1,3-beta-D-glucosidase